MKILVTGGSGFIGSHLVERLVKGGHIVKVLIRKEDYENKEREDSMRLLNELNVELCKGDLTDKDSLKKAVKNTEIIFHLAAIARPMAIPDKKYFEVNEKGTQNLFEACLEEDLEKIVMMSSVSVVGPALDGIAINEESKCHPVDIYGESKLAQEKVAEKFILKYGLPIVILRPPMVFGERDLEMLKLFKTINKRFFPLSGRNKCMEFLYVKNLVKACILAMEQGRVGEKYHVTNGEHYSINDITNEISRALNKKIINIKLPYFTFVIMGYFIEGVSKIFRVHPPFKHDTIKWMTKFFWYSDCTKIKRELGYLAEISLEEGVKRTVKYYKKKGFL